MTRLVLVVVIGQMTQEEPEFVEYLIWYVAIGDMTLAKCMLVGELRFATVDG
jgi:hypothetical protein